MAAAERWAAGIAGPAYAIDDETAIKVVDGTVEVVSEGHWRLFDPEKSLQFAEMDAPPRETDLVALGRPGSGAYAGLESFPNPGVSTVELTSDELTALCPVTGQPDLYIATIEYEPDTRCLESKSLKLYLNEFRDQGHF